MTTNRSWRLGVPSLVALPLLAWWATVAFWSLLEWKRGAWPNEFPMIAVLLLCITVAVILAAMRLLQLDNASREQLTKNAQRFRTLLERAPDPTWIIDDNRFIECN